MPREKTEFSRFYEWYCESILKRPPAYANDGRILKDCSSVLKAAKEIGASMYSVQLLMLTLHHTGNEFTDFKPWNEWAPKNKLDVPISPRHFLYLHPKGRTDINLLQAELEIKDMPPQYNFFEFAEWVKMYGVRAIKSGIWDGIYPYQPFVDPAKNILPPDRLTEILGDEKYVKASLAKLREVEGNLKCRSKNSASGKK